jgi:hypothetical protein
LKRRREFVLRNKGYSKKNRHASSKRLRRQLSKQDKWSLPREGSRRNWQLRSVRDRSSWQLRKLSGRSKRGRSVEGFN